MESDASVCCCHGYSTRGVSHLQNRELKEQVILSICPHPLKVKRRLLTWNLYFKDATCLFHSVKSYSAVKYGVNVLLLLCVLAH